jgi:tetratricopeptide (TPR) repeat protein
MAKKSVLIPLLPLLILFLSGTLHGWHWYEPAARKNQNGIRAYEEGRFAEALQNFLSAKGVNPDAPELKNNTAAALYELKKYKEALDEFSRLDPGRLPQGKAGFYYNLGNSHFRLGQFPQALENYKKSLRQNPDDNDAKINYELTLKKIREQQGGQDPNPQPRAGEQRQDEARQKQKYDAMMQFLNQNEKQQLEKKKRRINAAKNEKDW